MLGILAGEMSGRFSLSHRLASFRFAIAGLRQLLVAEHNARIHAAISIFVVSAGVWMELDRLEWCWIVLAISLVWLAEAFNTAIERLGDAITQEQSPQIGMAKDIAASAVLIASIASTIIGVFILGPHLVATLRL